jgi:hypothetical protein
MLCPNAAALGFAGDGYGQAVVSSLIQGVVSGAIQCAAIRIAQEQKSVSPAKKRRSHLRGIPPTALVMPSLPRSGGCSLAAAEPIGRMTAGN